MPSHASVMRQAPAPAASNSRVGGENPISAMLARLTFSTARGVALKALWSSVPTWPSWTTLGGQGLVVPSRSRRAGTAAPEGARRGAAGTPRRAPRGRAGGCRGTPDRPAKRGSGGTGWWVCGIERIVDRHAVRRAERAIGGDDRHRRRHRSAPGRARAARRAADAPRRPEARPASPARRRPTRCAARRPAPWP